MKLRLFSMEAALILGILTGIGLFLYYNSTTMHGLPKRIAQKAEEHLAMKLIPTPTLTDFCLDVPVLFYHHIQPLTKAKERWEDALSVDPVNFERHILYLKKQGFTFISLKDLVEALYARKHVGKAVVLMADDGYQDNYIYAFPIIKRQNIPFTIANVTGFSGKISPYTLPDEPKEYEFMSWTEMRKMEESGLVEFVNHSWTHQSLHKDNTDTIQKQVQVGQDQLKNNISHLQPIFVYPYGRYGDTVISILKAQNFKAAFSTDKGTQQCLSTIYKLPRMRVGNAGPRVYGM